MSGIYIHIYNRYIYIYKFYVYINNCWLSFVKRKMNRQEKSHFQGKMVLRPDCIQKHLFPERIELQRLLAFFNRLFNTFHRFPQGHSPSVTFWANLTPVFWFDNQDYTQIYLLKKQQQQHLHATPVLAL